MDYINPGIVLMILVAVYQSILSIIAKGISPHISTGVEVLAYYGIPLLFLIPVVIYKAQEYKTNHFGFYFLRGAFASGSVFCFFYASKMIPLSTAALLFNLTPVFVPLFARIFLGEVTSKQVLIGILISLAGVIVVMHPSMIGLFSPVTLVGLASGVLMAMAQVMLRHLSKIKEPPKKIVFYIYLASTFSSLFIILIENRLSDKNALTISTGGHSFLVISMLILLGLISLIAQRTLTKAFQYLPAAKLVPFLYISVPVSSLLGWILWKQQLTPNLLMGAGLILTGVLFITIEKNKESICVQQQEQPL
ncbi:MAG: EamA family transporter [Gammaproteobacteria bacterium]|nr:EamA family transporter [Gammaproteobacteria bacterium]